jgi:hypothetical protein
MCPNSTSSRLALPGQQPVGQVAVLPEPRLVREVGAAGHQQPDRRLTQRDPHRRQRGGIEVGQRFGLYAQHVPEQVVRVEHRETGIHQARSRLINVGHGHHLRRKRLSTFREGRKCQARVAPPASGRSMRAGFPPWSWILFSRCSTAMSRPFGSGPARPGGACALERDATSRFPSGRVAGRRRGCQLANRGDSPGPQRRGGTDTEPLGVTGREPAGVPEPQRPSDVGPVCGAGTLKLLGVTDIADASQRDGDQAKGAELQGRALPTAMSERRFLQVDTGPHDPLAAHFRALAASRRSVKARSRWVCRSSVRSVHHRRMAIE